MTIDRRTFLKLAMAFSSYFLLTRNRATAETEEDAEQYADVWSFGGDGLAFPAWFPIHPRVPVPEEHKTYLPLVMNG